MHFVFFLAVTLLLGIAGISDFLRYRIPNWVNLALLILFAPYVWYAGLSWQTVGLHFAFAVAVMVLGFILFWLRAMGGGDVKLFSVLAMWLGLEKFFFCFVYTSIAGVVLIIMVVYLRKLPLEWVKKHAPVLVGIHQRKKAGIPYGVAISLGGLASYAQLLL